MEAGVPEGAPRVAGRMAPEVAWKAFTDAPLSGCALARETATLLAWDESRQVYLFDAQGQRIQAVRAPAPVLSARISDDGSLIALLAGGPRLILLDAKLAPIADRPGPSGALILDTDSHGHYVVVVTRQAENLFYTRTGKAAGKFTTRQPLTHVRFVPGRPFLVGAAGYGVLMGISLHPGSSPGSLKAEAEWEERLMSNLGRLEVTGDGTMVLASCFNLGVQRYNAEGQNEGSYHLGGTAIHAVPDFPGRSIAVATQEGHLAVLNRSGNVRWRAELESPPLGLAIDALGRFLIYGLPSGEIVRLDLEPRDGPKPVKRRAEGPRPSSNLRRPDWMTPIAKSSDDAEVAVVVVQGEPERIAVLTKGNRFRVFDSRGRECGEGPELRGIGRILRTSRGWIAAATDRQIVLHESQNETYHRPDLDLVQVTHLAIRPDSYGMAVVQERDRIGRVTVAGRWVWRKELRRPIEDVAIGPHGLTAYTNDEGVFQILDAAGEEPARAPFRSEEPLLLVEAPIPSEGTSTVAFITLSRQAQVLRGHAADGQVRWESPTPWEGWQLQRVGQNAVVVAPDGKVLAYNEEGYLKEQGGPVDATFVLGPGPAGSVLRLMKRDKQLLCATLSGQAIWRAIAEEGIGPMAGETWGVAVYQGLQLCCYRQPPP